MIRRNGHAMVLLTAALTVFAAPLRAGGQDKDPWAPLRFLIGSWTGGGSGRPGEAISGDASFTYDLEKKVMIRKNRAESAPKSGEKSGAVHEDLMIIYPQAAASSFRAIYFDSEGHVIQYAVTLPGKDRSVVFESDGTDKQPRFRLVYEADANGGLRSEFFVAAPGGEFKSYVKGTMKKASKSGALIPRHEAARQ